MVALTATGIQVPHFDVAISNWGMPPTCRAQQQEQSRGRLRLAQCTQNRIRLPVPWLPSDHSPWGAERRARTTAVAILAAAHIGTYAYARGAQARLALGTFGYAANRLCGASTLQCKHGHSKSSEEEAAPVVKILKGLEVLLTFVKGDCSVINCIMGSPVKGPPADRADAKDVCTMGVAHVAATDRPAPMARAGRFLPIRGLRNRDRRCLIFSNVAGYAVSTMCDPWSGSDRPTRPPGWSTRAISSSAVSASGTWIKSALAHAASNEPLANGSSVARPINTLALGCELGPP